MPRRAFEPPNRRRLRTHPAVETLEGRALLSVVPSRAGPAGRAFELGRLRLGQATPAEQAAVLAALRGGLGREFATLARREIRNVNGVIAGFASGSIRDYSVPGLSIKTKNWQELYTGPHHDQLGALAAGAVLASPRRLVLGAVLVGPIDMPSTNYYVFGLDRGTAGAGSPFSNRPNIRYDAAVTVATAGTQAVSVVLDDLATGQSTPLPTSVVRVRGATLVVVLDPRRLAVAGAKPLPQARFAFWTRSAATGQENVANFVPESATIPIGVLGRR